MAISSAQSSNAAECIFELDKCYNVLDFEDNVQVSCLEEFDYSKRICINYKNEELNDAGFGFGCILGFLCLIWFLEIILD